MRYRLGEDRGNGGWSLKRKVINYIQYIQECPNIMYRLRQVMVRVKADGSRGAGLASRFHPEKIPR
jgi:hypothetical protein